MISTINSERVAMLLCFVLASELLAGAARGIDAALATSRKKSVANGTTTSAS
ncbi:MAG: hypothetical protein JO215_00340 [Ktedonobacteraceae bacterium]|nr:hypothetical protein [Ktedonobacteraceae bacterium]